ncbi:hypothetical protein L6164_006986 [Bauhinia variegata]|uniref:Uncharacterized protein n=1 Tax=Bauhinia variegata TaxID=167791 RepID=A0ACB9PVH5_BAUVA|nr:hypothetical protein L6164_006986 [Bauhinia variegata]
MQDWNYIHAGCFELTLEVSDDKWPNAAETGVHGRIVSSLDGRPLPGSIVVRDTNYTVRAGKTVADYHRLLAPRDTYEVIATMPGYKSKSTTISLDAGPVTLNFVLDPEVLIKGPEFVDIFCGAHLEVYFVLIVILGFLCLIFKRRMKVNFLKHRQSGGAKGQP